MKRLAKNYFLHAVFFAAFGYNTYRHPSTLNIVLLAVLAAAFAYFRLAPAGKPTARGIRAGTLAIIGCYLAMVGTAVWQLIAGPLWAGLLVAAVTVFAGVVLVPAVRASFHLAKLMSAEPRNGSGS